MDIKINIKNKIAELAEPARIVCGNSDYTAVFAFDAEWAAYQTKTARFMHGGTYTDVVFTGERCPIPVLSNTTGVYIGVYAGNLCTTTPAYVGCEKSILCDGGTPAAPTEDVYTQILALLAEINKGGTLVTIDGEAVLTFPADTFIAARLAELVNSAPATLDTLAEIATALGNDPNFATTILAEIGKKADAALMETAIASKQDKATGVNHIWGTDANGNQALFTWAQGASGKTIPFRTPYGQIRVKAAVNDEDAVNLAQMREALEQGGGALYRHTVYLHAYGNGATISVTATLFNTNDAQINTFDALYAYLEANGEVMASGALKYGTDTITVDAINCGIGTYNDNKPYVGFRGFYQSSISANPSIYMTRAVYASNFTSWIVTITDTVVKIS